jgi:hypothetical protein
MRASLALLVAAALLAGCASDTPGAPDAAPDPGIQYQDDTIAVQDPDALPSEPPLPGERTLAKAPEWRLGEWWKYRMVGEFDGSVHEFYRVVAGSEAGNYLVGFPVNEFSNDILVMHVPGYGDISRSDLSYETHDAVFKLLQFPLRDGDSWEMSFEGVSDGTAMVSLPGDGTALIEAPTQSFNITAVYDPEVGEITSLSISGYASYEVSSTATTGATSPWPATASSASPTTTTSSSSTAAWPACSPSTVRWSRPARPCRARP